MDTNKLQAFLTTLRLGSFSKAAEELHCTQSAISQLMNHMEDELGCQLLIRTHRGIDLTSDGRALLPAIMTAAAALDKLANEADALRKGQQLPIRIGAFSSISNTWLPALIKKYQDAHPDIIFQILIGTDSLPEWLMAGKIDIALGDDERCRHFSWQPLMEDRYYAVVPQAVVTPDKTVMTHAELASHPLIMAPRNALQKHLQATAVRETTISCDDDSTLLSMVAQGLGVTAMPALSLRHVPDGVCILELVPRTERILGLATLREMSPAVADFAAFVKSEAGHLSAGPIFSDAGRQWRCK